MNINILIDGHYFFMKTIFVTQQLMEQNGNDISETKQIFIEKLTKDLLFLLKKFPVKDNVIFVSDYGSWRNKIHIETTEGYKKQRKKIDLRIFFETFDDFFKILEKNNINTYKQKNLEGDDLLYLFSKKYFKNGEDVIVVTGDMDMLQLVKFDKRDENFVVVFNPNSKRRTFYATKEMIEWTKNYDFDDIFSVDILGNKSVMEKLFDEFGVKEIDPNDFLIKKIIVGDKGDNIPSVYRWATKTNPNKFNRITENRAEKLLENINIESPFGWYEDGAVNELKIGLEKMTKTSVDEFDLAEKIDRNMKLMFLDEKFIPDDLLREFYNNIENKEFSRLGKLAPTPKEFLKNTNYQINGDGTKSDIFSLLKKYG